MFSGAYQFGLVFLALGSKTCRVCGWPEEDECVCACLCECVSVSKATGVNRACFLGASFSLRVLKKVLVVYK